MKVAAVMSRRPWTCKENDSLETAVRLLWDNDIGSVVVVDNDSRAIAMLTDRDACMAAYTQGLPLRDIPVGTAMSRGLVACRAEDSVLDAWSLMRSRLVRRLPVVDESGAPIGVVSLSDIVRAQSDGKDRRTKDLTFNDMTSTLAEISAPRRKATS